MSRDDVMTVRMTPAEKRMVKDLAEADGISPSDVLRMLVRRAHESRFPKKRGGR